MSGSLTVIGGQASTSGLVSIPSSFIPSVNTSLQNYLNALSTSVAAGTVTLLNENVAGDNGTVTAPNEFTILELTNTDTAGAVSGGNATIQTTVPSSVLDLIVQAPGAETITGNNSDGSVAIFGANSSVTYTATSGSGSVYASGNDNVLVNGTSYTVIGGSLGGSALNVISDTGFVETEGGSNVILIGGFADTVLSGGSNDLIGAASASGQISVSGFANIIGTSGSTTITAVGSGSINAFVGSGFAGKLYFINSSTSASTITGLAGSVTAFGGVGGGHYEGGALGSNSLIGGSGLVTLNGSSAGSDTLVAGGSGAGFNVINAGGQDSTGAVTTGGNQVLESTSLAGTTYFQTNEGLDQVSASGSGTQYFFLNSTGESTISGSTAAKNQFYISQSTVDSTVTDVISHFNVNTDNFSIVNSSVSITGVSSFTGGSDSGSIVNLSNGTRIELLGVTASSVTVSGGNSF